MNFLWIFLIIIVALIIVVLIFVLIQGTRQHIVLQRLEEFEAFEEEKEAGGKGRIASYEEQELNKPFFERMIQPLLVGFSKKFQKKDADGGQLAKLITMAGNPYNITPAQFKALQLLCAMVSVTFIALFALPLGAFSTQQGIALTMAGMAGLAGMSFVLPQFVLKSAITKRQKLIRKSIPDVLDLMVVAVEAGMGFDQAVSKLVERGEGPLIEEFGRMLQEIKLGKRRPEALRGLGERTEVEELNSLISAIIQADQLGVAVGQVLRIQAEQLRVRRRQKIEEEAQKIPIKMLIPMILFIFPVIFIVVMVPVVIKVMNSMPGK